MYLLIQGRRNHKRYVFTNLHPTMYLLILRKFLKLNTHINNLHPTMYLLILITADTNNKLDIFTSHYVSINSVNNDTGRILVDKFTSHYVSINSASLFFSSCASSYLHPTMYLLILIGLEYTQRLSTFTSHYVSINSNTLPIKITR